jgi:hypothetical protein
VSQMKRPNLLCVGLALTLMPCWAGVDEIKHLFQTALASGGAVPSRIEFFSAVNEDTVRPLSVQEVNNALPLAKRALDSRQTEMGQYGLLFFMVVGLRPDSSKLLEPYVDDLGALANGPKGAQSLRHGALLLLGTTHPSIIPKAVPYLLGNLEDEANSGEETLTIAASLLEAFPANREIIEKVVGFVQSRSDTGLTTGVLRQVGLMKSRDPRALSLIGSNLDSANRGIRYAAVDAVSRLDRDVRGQFARQVARIATDDKESAELRSMADAALTK